MLRKFMGLRESPILRGYRGKKKLSTIEQRARLRLAISGFLVIFSCLLGGHIYYVLKRKEQDSNVYHIGNLVQSAKLSYNNFVSSSLGKNFLSIILQFGYGDSGRSKVPLDYSLANETSACEYLSNHGGFFEALFMLSEGLHQIRILREADRMMTVTMDGERGALILREDIYYNSTSCTSRTSVVDYLEGECNVNGWKVHEDCDDFTTPLLARAADLEPIQTSAILADMKSLEFGRHYTLDDPYLMLHRRISTTGLDILFRTTDIGTVMLTMRGSVLNLKQHDHTPFASVVVYNADTKNVILFCNRGSMEVAQMTSVVHLRNGTSRMLTIRDTFFDMVRESLEAMPLSSLSNGTVSITSAAFMLRAARAGPQTNWVIASWSERNRLSDAVIFESRMDYVTIALIVMTAMWMATNVHWLGKEVRIRRKAENETRRLNLTLEKRVIQRTSQVEEARLLLQDALSVRTAFLSRMSHEIRTPLNGVLGLVEMILASRMLAAEVRTPLEIVKRSSQTLLVILNDVLEVARLHSGRLNLESLAFSFKEAINDAVSLFSPRAEQLDISLSAAVHTERHLPEKITVRGDPYRISQILSNLIGNGLKFTGKQGKITLVVDAILCDSRGAREHNALTRGTVREMARNESMQFLRDSPRQLLGGVREEVAYSVAEAGESTKATTHVDIVVSVKDTGPGVNESEVALMFESFRQAKETHSRTHGGTGLGLSIARSLVLMMNGGDIGCLNRRDGVRGAHFWFRVILPRAQSSEAVSGNEQRQATSSSVKRELNLPALSGTTSLSSPDVHPELIMMSEAAKNVNSDNDTSNECSDTWRGDDEEEEREYEDGLRDGEETSALSVGADSIHVNLTSDKLTSDALSSRPLGASSVSSAVDLVSEATTSGEKPSASARLEDIAEGSKATRRLLAAEKAPRNKNWTELRPRSRSIACAPRTHERGMDGSSGDEFWPNTVLVVEDNPVNMLVAMSFLRLLGEFKIKSAVNGKKALEMYRATMAKMTPSDTDKHPVFHAVLMDCCMPVLDGFAASKAMRAIETSGRLKRTPIVALTALIDVESRQSCMDAGMDHILHKPVQMSDVGDMMRRVAHKEK